MCKKNKQPELRKVEDMSVDEVLEMFRLGAKRIKELSDAQDASVSRAEREWFDRSSELRDAADKLWRTERDRHGWRVLSFVLLVFLVAAAIGLVIVL